MAVEVYTHEYLNPCFLWAIVYGIVLADSQVYSNRDSNTLTEDQISSVQAPSGSTDVTTGRNMWSKCLLVFIYILTSGY